MLLAQRYPEGAWSGPGLELRADGVPPEKILPAINAFHAERRRRDYPGKVVFTLRLQRDGGAWENGRAREREVIWSTLAENPEPIFDLIDLEIEEAGTVSPHLWDAWQLGKQKVLLSHHALIPEPMAECQRRLEEMRIYRPDAVKFAVAVPDVSSAESLLRFARIVAGEFPLSAVLGMGEAGRCTRVLSPLLGCPITYGYLEGKPIAPGQVSAETLRAFFAAAGNVAGREKTEAEWMTWSQKLLEDVSHAA